MNYITNVYIGQPFFGYTFYNKFVYTHLVYLSYWMAYYIIIDRIYSVYNPVEHGGMIYHE